MLHKCTHKRLGQHATACLGNRFNSLCHEALALLQASRLGHAYADNCHQPPSRTTSLLSAITSLCQPLQAICFNPKVSVDLPEEDILPSFSLPPALSGQ